MFSITICIMGQGRYGIAGLDWRRERGLPDGVRTKIDACAFTFNVDEDFARKHFGPEQISSDIRIHMDRLTTRDVSINADNPDYVVVNLTSDRAKEIYLEWLGCHTSEEVTR